LLVVPLLLVPGLVLSVATLSDAYVQWLPQECEWKVLAPAQGENVPRGTYTFKGYSKWVCYGYALGNQDETEHYFGEHYVNVGNRNGELKHYARNEGWFVWLAWNPPSTQSNEWFRSGTETTQNWPFQGTATAYLSRHRTGGDSYDKWYDEDSHTWTLLP